MWTWLAYTWRVAANLFYLAIVLYVFSRLQQRLETIVVALFGVIYVTIRGIGGGLAIALTGITLAIGKDLDLVKSLVHADYTYSSENYAEMDKKNVQTAIKFYIDIFFLGLISLFCLWQLFSVL